MMLALCASTSGFLRMTALPVSSDGLVERIEFFLQLVHFEDEIFVLTLKLGVAYLKLDAIYDVEACDLSQLTYRCNGDDECSLHVNVGTCVHTGSANSSEVAGSSCCISGWIIESSVDGVLADGHDASQFIWKVGDGVVHRPTSLDLVPVGFGMGRQVGNSVLRCKH